jgi:hypothetical protein
MPSLLLFFHHRTPRAAEPTLVFAFAQCEALLVKCELRPYGENVRTETHFVLPLESRKNKNCIMHARAQDSDLQELLHAPGHACLHCWEMRHLVPVKRYSGCEKPKCVSRCTADLGLFKQAYQSANCHRSRSPSAPGCDIPYAQAGAIQGLGYPSYLDSDSSAAPYRPAVCG